MYFRYAIHFFLFVVFVTFAGFIGEVDADPPGAKISPLPLSSMKMFKDDEIFTGEVFFNVDIKQNTFYYSSPTGADLSQYWTMNYVDPGNYQRNGNSGNQLAAADAGRFIYGTNDTDRHRESVILADFIADSDSCGLLIRIFHKNQFLPDSNYIENLPQTKDYMNAPKSVDVKVGDLDLLTDADGRLHDEAVVTFTYGDYAERVAVYVYKLTPDDESCRLTAVTSFSFDRPDDDEILDLVSVNIGDYNGDRFPDIAVTAGSSAADKPGIVNVYSYDHDSENQVGDSHVLTLKSSREVDQYGKNMDTASGDFDGDGKDELAVFSGSTELSGTTDLYVGILQYGSEWNHTNDTYHTNYLLDSNYVEGTPADPNGLRVEAGNFLFDPANGYGLRKKQVVVAWTYEHRYLSSGVFDLSSLMVDNENLPVRLSYDRRDVDGGANIYRAGKFDIAVGNFVGHRGKNDETNNSVTDQWILQSVWEEYREEAYRQYPVTFVYHLDADRTMHWNVVNQSNRKTDGLYANTPVAVAFDNDGDMWRLGAPTHLVFNDVVSLDQIIQEPPKHVDYLPVDPDIWDGKWEIRNISGSRDFKMVYEEIDEGLINHKSINTSTWTIGGAANLQASLSAETPWVTVELENKTKLSYNYDSNKSSYNSSYASREATLSAETNTDDFLHGTLKTIHVWRYPILNYYTVDISNPLGVWELVLPFNKAQPFSCNGMTFGDWYQPLHENRNVLSYPQYVNYDQWPTDEEVGCFKWYDDSGNPTETCDVLNSVQTYIWGNAATEEIRWTDTSGSGSAKEYSHTLSASTEITLATKVDASFPFIGGVEAQASFGVEFHNSNSWGGATQEECESSNTKGITLEIPVGGELDLAYGFQTAAYITSTGGAFKVAHATHPLASSSTSDLWKKYYNRRPDPALNLPNKFEFHTPSGDHLGDWWTLNTKETRKQMRGFFLRSNKINDLSGKHPILAMAPMEGDIVQLCARVYNYSIGRSAKDVDVKFYYYKWDTFNSETIGEPVSQDDMKDTILYLDGIQGAEPSMIEVCVPWNTAGLYDDSNAYVGYRFMVILDEENEIDEIHEFKDAKGNEVPGGNNSGYWPWSNAVFVMPKQVADPHLSKPDVSMQRDSLAIETENGLVTDGRGLEFVRGKTYRLRAHLTSDMDHSVFRHVFFFEGDPDSNGKVFANQLSFGVKTGRASIWTNWTPQETGEKTLYVRYIEDQQDSQPGNSQDSLKVTVVELVQLQEGLIIKNKNAEGEDRITFKLENCLNLSDLISELADSSVHISVSTTDGDILYSSGEISGDEFWPNGNETRYEYKEQSPEKGKVTLLPGTNEIVADIKKTTIGEITDDTTNITVRITIGPKTYKAVNTWTLKKDNKKTKLIFR